MPEGTLMGAYIPGDREIPQRRAGEGPSARRRFSLGVTAGLHRLVAGLTADGVARAKMRPASSR
jgi:hypothetical protein